MCFGGSVGFRADLGIASTLGPGQGPARAIDQARQPLVGNLGGCFWHTCHYKVAMHSDIKQLDKKITKLVRVLKEARRLGCTGKLLSKFSCIEGYHVGFMA